MSLSVAKILCLPIPLVASLVATVLLGACSAGEYQDQALERNSALASSTSAGALIPPSPSSSPAAASPAVTKARPAPERESTSVKRILPNPVPLPSKEDTQEVPPETLTVEAADSAWPENTDGKGCAAPIWKSGPPENDPSRVLIVGDSLTRESQPSLQQRLAKKGWLPTVRCWGGKGTVWGKEQIQRARKLDNLPSVVVVALGTNDVWWLGTDLGSGVDSIMKSLGPKRKVYWVNLLFGPNGYGLEPPTEANRLLVEKAEEYKNLEVIDFATAYKAAMAKDSSVGWADGVHLNSAGYRVRNSLIVKALNAARASR